MIGGGVRFEVSAEGMWLFAIAPDGETVALLFDLEQAERVHEALGAELERARREVSRGA